MLRPLSPSRYARAKADIIKRLDGARRVGDLESTQRALADWTQLERIRSGGFSAMLENPQTKKPRPG
jgi:hypothetical protein